MNRRTSSFLLAACMFILLNSCTPSYYPLFKEQDLVFDPQLLGKWGRFERNNVLFTKSGDKSYSVIWTEEDPRCKNVVSHQFEGHLVRLGSFLFLDLFPADEDKNKPQGVMFSSHFVPAHTFYRFSREGEVDEDEEEMIHLTGIDSSGVREMIEDGEVTISHVFSQASGLLLTAPTGELQEFVVKYAEDNRIFRDAGPGWPAPISMSRCSPVEKH